MKWLKKQGADVNAKDKKGQTPMHYAAAHAAMEHQLGNMKWLKEQGADLNAKDNEGKTPLSASYAESFAGTNEVKEWLHANGAK